MTISQQLEYYYKNRSKCIERNKQYYRKNLNKISEYNQKYFSENKEKIQNKRKERKIKVNALPNIVLKNIVIVKNNIVDFK